MEMPFNYRSLRTLVGLCAFGIIIFSFLLYHLNASSDISTALIPKSISLTYHLGARDFFVGILSIIASFLFCYKGHDSREKQVSSWGALFAVLVAIVPTELDKMWVLENGFSYDIRYCKEPNDLEGLYALSKAQEKQRLCNVSRIPNAPIIHYLSAIFLIGTLIFFCHRFYVIAKSKIQLVDKNSLAQNVLYKRTFIYNLCLIFMIGSIVIIISWKFLNPNFESAIFWIESICLVAFGTSWLVAGKQILFKIPNNEKGIDEEDRLSEMLDHEGSLN